MENIRNNKQNDSQNVDAHHCSGSGDCIVVADDGQNSSEESGVTLNSTNRNDQDVNVIRNKRVELENIQSDLDDLMYRLNSFISDSYEDLPDDVSTEDSMSIQEEDLLNVTEKQDGPPEKELRLNSYASAESLTNKIYITDGTNPPEINWENVGPILQKHVADLQRLHILNQMTNAVVKRIRNVTQINEAILKETGWKQRGE